MGLAEDIIYIIIAGLATGLVANRLGIPPIVGYIIGGIIIGPHTGGITVSDVPRIELLAEIGVALLLFSIGLDLSFKEIRSVRAVALIGTTVQIALTALFGFGMGRLMGLPAPASVVLGMTLSLSSTMVVLKTLMNRGLMGTLSSRVMVGMLIVQDLAAIPLMIFIPHLVSTGDLASLGLVILKAAVLLGAIVVVGMRVLPLVLKTVARLESRELFLITVTAIGLGVGFCTHLFGLSLAFGAFVAGMVINQSEYSHQALSDIIPLRDIFGLFFFTSIGMLLDPAFLLANLSTVAMLVPAIIGAKFIIFFAITRAFRYRNIVPLAAGLSLAQIGEFSFVLARTGLQNNVIDRGLYALILATAVITMIVTPFLAMLAGPLYSLRNRFFRTERYQTVNLPAGGLTDHVVIAGGGRVGATIAGILHHLGVACAVIDQDFRRFEQARGIGCTTVFGDATQEPVLAAAGVMRARLLIMTVPSIQSARTIIATALSLAPGIAVIARGDSDEQADELYAMRVREVVRPEFEAGLEIIRQSLLALDYPAAAIQQYTDDVRRSRSSPLLRANADYSLLAGLRSAAHLLELAWIDIAPESPAAGRSIKDLAVRSRTGVSVVGVFRDGLFTPNPDADFSLRENDHVAIIGTPAGKKAFESLVAPGEAGNQPHTEAGT